ncbi:beta-ketoacyl-[acyl-carrier-protein] synthase family protein [Bianquea renquensis]|jgi:auaC protein|uniref:Beta-ketoacyl-[acyl-carrier-protein] synthase family protein n=1 Tax=Bianquea renquensis TaxID=2763661 RepID=A0A926DV82_9FIRM|nr:beta-ketoacyl-[acyl-carrier-protein] synthase family protein [Bianquea renquensis]MBC8544452.1 beta-ketoacyl-[acyl-carrier-protein] synthase family protein [Bianquea renquensis]
MRRRVVITGIGTASVCGFGKAAFWNGILKGDTHFQKVNDAFYGADFQGQYGFLDREEQSLFEAQYLSEEERKSLHPCARLALAVALSAAEDAGLKKFDGEISPERVGVSVGTTHGEINVMESMVQENGAVPMEQIKDSIHHIDIAAAIARRMKAAGDVVLHSDACSSGNVAAAYGFQMIRRGRLDRVLAGGVDVYSKLTEGGFTCIRALTSDRVRPFDKNRSGIILSEGAGMLVLEDYETAKARGAHIYGEILGQGQSNDAYHMASMDPEAAEIQVAMGNAVQDAGILKGEIEYICLHGTGTISNDNCEMKAIPEFFGERAETLHVSSIKGALGHALGGAAALELVACSLSLESGIIPPNCNLLQKDSHCTLHLVRQPLNAKPSVIMNSSYAFGGSNCCIVLGKVGEGCA